LARLLRWVLAKANVVGKGELVARVAESTGMRQTDVKLLLNTFAEVVTDALASGDGVQLVGFGAFGVRSRAKRKMSVPGRKEVLVPERKVPFFKPGQRLKDAVKV